VTADYAMWEATEEIRHAVRVSLRLTFVPEDHQRQGLGLPELQERYKAHFSPISQ
jgi:hypothetical protein